MLPLLFCICEKKVFGTLFTFRLIHYTIHIGISSSEPGHVIEAAKSEGCFLYNRIFWGIVLIGIGILFILDRQGIIVLDIGYIVSTFWPLILIYYGFKGLFSQFKWGHGIGFRYLYPLILITIGVYFLGRNIDYIEMSAGDFFQFVIPFLLIIIGVIIILKPGKRLGRDQEEPSAEFTGGQHHDWNLDPNRGVNPDMNDDLGHYPDRDQDNDASRPRREEFDPYPQPPFPDPGPQTHVVHADPVRNYHAQGDGHGQQASMESHFSFIGDIHIGSANWKLKPLNIQHFIGDTVIDLTRAYIPDGVTKITVGSLIGDVRIMLPGDPDVAASVTMSSFAGESDVFGKREGGMMKNRREESPNYGFAPKKLHIMVNMFIGDIRIDRI